MPTRTTSNVDSVETVSQPVTFDNGDSSTSVPLRRQNPIGRSRPVGMGPGALRTMKRGGVHEHFIENNEQADRLVQVAELAQFRMLGVDQILEEMTGEEDSGTWQKAMDKITQVLQEMGVTLFPWDDLDDSDVTGAQQEALRLQQQLKHYPGGRYPGEVRQLLSESGVTDALYEGIEKYEKSKAGLLDKYQPKYDTLDKNSPTFFREALINHVTRRQFDGKLPGYRGSDEIRTQNPSAATISLEEFLGKEGSTLYALALAEEANSREFREECLANSLGRVDGVAWQPDHCPAMVVGGPSASGKTYATQAAMEKFAERFGTPSPDAHGLYMSIDGGNVRASSQIKKYMVQLANQQGFTGISNLHSKSKVLGSVKANLLNAVKDVEGLGIALPDTFSDYVMPLPMPHLVKTLLQFPRTQLVSVQVCAPGGDANHKKFTTAVRFQGESRAWKTAFDSAQEQIDLNRAGSDIPESKAYSARSFGLAETGSGRFRKEYGKTRMSMDVINDRVLIKKDETGGDYVPAQLGDAGAFLYSQSTLDAWRKAGRTQALAEYQKSISSSPIILMRVPISVSGPSPSIDAGLPSSIGTSVSSGGDRSSTVTKGPDDIFSSGSNTDSGLSSLSDGRSSAASSEQGAVINAEGNNARLMAENKPVVMGHVRVSLKRAVAAFVELCQHGRLVTDLSNLGEFTAVDGKYKIALDALNMAFGTLDELGAKTVKELGDGALAMNQAVASIGQYTDLIFSEKKLPSDTKKVKALVQAKDEVFKSLGVLRLEAKASEASYQLAMERAKPEAGEGEVTADNQTDQRAAPVMNQGARLMAENKPVVMGHVRVSLKRAVAAFVELCQHGKLVTDLSDLGEFTAVDGKYKAALDALNMAFGTLDDLGAKTVKELGDGALAMNQAVASIGQYTDLIFSEKKLPSDAKKVKVLVQAKDQVFKSLGVLRLEAKASEASYQLAMERAKHKPSQITPPENSRDSVVSADSPPPTLASGIPDVSGSVVDPGSVRDRDDEVTTHAPEQTGAKKKTTILNETELKNLTDRVGNFLKACKVGGPSESEGGDTFTVSDERYRSDVLALNAAVLGLQFYLTKSYGDLQENPRLVDGFKTALSRMSGATSNIMARSLPNVKGSKDSRRASIKEILSKKYYCNVAIENTEFELAKIKNDAALAKITQGWADPNAEADRHVMLAPVFSQADVRTLESAINALLATYNLAGSTTGKATVSAFATVLEVLQQNGVQSIAAIGMDGLPRLQNAVEQIMMFYNNVLADKTIPMPKDLLAVSQVGDQLFQACSVLKREIKSADALLVRAKRRNKLEEQVEQEEEPTEGDDEL